MKFYSTNNRSAEFSFKDAVINGLAPDGGLFMPERIPQLEQSFFEELPNLSFQEISFRIAKLFIEKEIPENDLAGLIEDAINFPAPVVKLNDKINILELFHGPTLAFKDFGARFMSRVLGYFAGQQNEEINILVATSGDTGSAVASGFYETEGINVYILYPSGKVSEIQEKQLTTLGKNITALEIDGTFDDCQRLVKQAFVDPELISKIKLSSANSINIARLIPQSFYYFESFKQLRRNDSKIIYCVPSGNLGNLTAGLFAKKMGLPINKFIAATNANSVFTEFIETGKFSPRPSVSTYSNAMDVGNPSNLARIVDLYQEAHSIIVKEIDSNSHNDRQTIDSIKKVYNDFGYIIDPHGAVGILAISQFMEQNNIEDYQTVVLETAHPAKFKNTIDSALGIEIEIPDRLQKFIDKEKYSIRLSNNYKELKQFLLK